MPEDLHTNQNDPCLRGARTTPAHKISGRGNDSIITHATAPPEKYPPLRPRQSVRAKPIPSPAAELSLTLCTKGETGPISQGVEVVGPQQPTKCEEKHFATLMDSFVCPSHEALVFGTISCMLQCHSFLGRRLLSLHRLVRFYATKRKHASCSERHHRQQQRW